jgi:predicted nucleic acid-binding protein
MIVTNATNILIDTGFWFALFDDTDSKHRSALSIWDEIENSRVLLPWPTLYECVNSRFVKNVIAMRKFAKILKRANSISIDDKNYKETARDLAFDERNISDRKISLVDHVMRLMLNDKNLRIDAMLTVDEKDFFDACRKNNVDIFPLQARKS